MARFRLSAKHYLNVTVPGRKIIWRYEEVSRDGIANQSEFPVPLYLDPEDQRWHNDKEHGIVVATEASSEHPRDYILAGEPTVDMEPLDDEAQELRESLMPKWTNPIESMPAQGLSPAEQAFMETMMKAMAGFAPPSNVDVTALQKRMEDLEAMNAKLVALLEGKSQSSVEAKPSARRA